MLKRILFLCTAVLSIAMFSQVAYGVEILFEHRTQTQPSRGVTYEQNRMVTTNGMLDVHVLIVDLNQPHIYIDPVTSANEIGRKETTTTLLRDAGAIGGINADFFGLAGSHSVHFGPMVIDGELLAANAYTNNRNNEFATFFMDMHNTPFYRYLRSYIRFYNNGNTNIELNAFNTIGNAIYWPIVVDRQIMDDTIALDRRFPGLSKIVVDNGRITRVSQPGEPIIIPENGYIVILPARMAYRRRYFNVGETANLVLSNNQSFDFSAMRTAVGGGAMVLSGGEVVSNRGVAPAARHPRSAIGTSRDGRRLILMAVDGRNHSVGVTHAELGQLLLRYGAYNAMHFDGGGSTTLVSSTRGENHFVANTPSDGGQRRVINAFGIFDRSPVGAMLDISLEMETPRAIVGLPLTAQVFGVDNFENHIPLNMANVTLAAANADLGSWQNGQYTPRRQGAHVLTAAYGTFNTTLTINAYTLAALQPTVNALSMFEGDSASLGFTGVATCGTSLPIPAFEGLSVNPPTLGHFENGMFVATSAGAGYISAVIGTVSAFIPVSVGGFPQTINMNAGQVSAHASPGNIVNNRVAREAGRINMNFSFNRHAQTQNAYTVFNPPLAIPAGAIGLRLDMYGDGSGHWLRGRVRDAEGNTHLIDFTRNADFTGRETVIARLPNVPGPLTIDQILLSTLDSFGYTRHSVAFYGLDALFAPRNQVTVPQSTGFVDQLQVNAHFTGLSGTNIYSFNVPQEAEYSFARRSNFAVITMAASGGGISAANRDQWAYLARDTRALNSENVVILMDANPLRFTQRMEFELFHLVMQDLRNEGRLVFVVSATGDSTQLTMRDGVRYINLARPQDGDTAAIELLTSTGQVWWR